nr:MAG TPA: hypothetical protein [Caudoviricetes sp.]
MSLIIHTLCIYYIIVFEYSYFTIIFVLIFTSCAILFFIFFYSFLISHMYISFFVYKTLCNDINVAQLYICS